MGRKMTRGFDGGIEVMHGELGGGMDKEMGGGVGGRIDGGIGGWLEGLIEIGG